MLSRHLLYVSLAVLFFSTAALFNVSVVQAQEEIYAGRNINMVSGTRLAGETGQRVALGGDPYLQRQNEPSIALSARNPMHLLAGANDYRTVDIPGLPDEEVIGDSWLGLFKSFDGGQTWQSTLMPGYPQAKNEQEGINSPIYGYDAAADPTVKAGTNGLFYYSGIAFDRGNKSNSVIFVSRFIDLNNREGAYFDVVANKDPIKFIDTKLLRGGTPGQFTDKPWMAVDIPRGNTEASFDLTDYKEVIDPDTGEVIEEPATVHQQFGCGNVYVAYAVFLGQDELNLHTRVEMVRSTDCGTSWSKPIQISDYSHLNQGVTLAIDPRNGDVYAAWQAFDYDEQRPQIMISKSTNGGQKFSKPVQVALTLPFNQETRPSPEMPDDPFRLFRTNAYPTMAIDNTGRVYIAWSERGFWGSDNLKNWEWEDGVQYSILDGSRIMFSYSTKDWKSWETPYPAVMSDFNCPIGEELCLPGHQIMPSLSYAGGKLTLLYYSFQQDFYPDLYNQIKANAAEKQNYCDELSNTADQAGEPSPREKCENWIAEGPIDTSLPPADAIAFEPYPIRHTIDARVAIADTSDASPFGQQVSQPASQYLSTFTLDNSGQSPKIKLQKIQSNQVNLPLFQGGTSPFIGDYIDIAASQPFIFDDIWGKWEYNDYKDTANDPVNSLVFHAVWADNRDVMAPPVKINDDGELERPDWTKYEPPTGKACSEDYWPGMRNQNIYTSRITQGLVLGSYGNSKPLNIERAFSIFVENTIPEFEFVTVDGLDDPLYLPKMRTFELKLEASDGGVDVCFDPFLSDGTCPNPDIGGVQYKLVEVASLSRVALTVFAKFAELSMPAEGSPIEYYLPSITVVANEIDGDLHSTLILNPDPSNPEPLNEDWTGYYLADSETHDPEFVPFTCSDFDTLPGEVHTNCSDNPTGSVPKLLVEWPVLYEFDPQNPQNPALMNPALMNTAENPALMNPALMNPALMNPALMNPALMNPALMNPALMNDPENPALMNPALMNPALMNPALMNPALMNDPENPALMNPALMNPALMNPALMNDPENPALMNPALMNPALMNPALMNPAPMTPALMNTAPSDNISSTLESIPRSTFLLQGKLVPHPGELPEDYPTLTDLTWRMKNFGNNTSSYFFSWFKNQGFNPDQILIYRTYKTPSVDLNTCLLNEAGLHYEFLANINNPDLLNPALMNRALSFSMAPSRTPSWQGGDNEEDYVYITLRFLDYGPQNGEIEKPGEEPMNPDDVAAATEPEAPPVNDPDQLIPPDVEGLQTSTLLFASPTTVGYGQMITFTAFVYDNSETYNPTGTVSFYDGNINRGSSLLEVINIGGTDRYHAVFSTSLLSAGNHVITAIYNGNANFSGSTSTPVNVYVNGIPQTITFGPLDDIPYEPDFEFDISATASSYLPVSFTAGPAGVCVEIDPASVDTTTIHIVGSGICTIKASQSGASNYAPAPDVIQSFYVFATVASLEFIQQPEDSALGQTLPEFSILVRDSGGTGMSSVPVTLLVGAGGCGDGDEDGIDDCTLSGEITILTDASGVAIFDSVKMDQGGWDYTLRAVAGLPPYDDIATTESDSFDVVGLREMGTNMTDRRVFDHTLLLQDGTVLVMGGYYRDTSVVTDRYYRTSIEIYDPQNGIWEDPRMPDPPPTYCIEDPPTDCVGTLRRDFTATLLSSGEILIVGGNTNLDMDFNSNNASDPSVTNDVEIYNPALDTLTPAAPMNLARAYHTATLLPDGRVLVAGGRVATDWGYTLPTTTAEIYDPELNTWTYTEDMHIWRDSHTATLLSDGRVLVVGGWYQYNDDPTDVEIYDPATETWSVVASPHSYQDQFHFATLLPNGNVLVMGGFGGPSPGSPFEVYNPATDSWSDPVDMGIVVGAPMTVLPDGKGLLVDAAYPDGITQPIESVLEIFDPVGGTWSEPLSTAPVPAIFREDATLLPDGRVFLSGGLSGYLGCTEGGSIFDCLYFLDATDKIFYPSRTKLEFTSQPSDSIADMAISDVTVRVTDNNGVGIRGIEVEMGLIPNSCPTCVLSGTTMRNTNPRGRTTFADLSLDSGGYGYRLVVSVPSLGIMVTSDPFDVEGFCAALSATPNPSVYGQTVSLTAPVPIISTGFSTGSVEFRIDGSPVETVVLDGSSPYAIYQVDDLDVGSYDISAVYIPDDPLSTPIDYEPLTLVVNRADQRITFNTIPNMSYPPESSFDVSGYADASSGLPLNFSIVSGPAYIADNTVTITGTGIVTIRAEQDGNGNYDPAEPVEQSFEVTLVTTESYLSFQLQPPEYTQVNQPISIEVKAEDPAHAAIPGLTVTLAIAYNPGGGILSGNLTEITDDTGVAAFEVSIDAAEIGYTLSASATGLTQVFSNAFGITTRCDVNIDGAVNVLDSVSLLNIIEGSSTCPGDCDITRDSYVNSLDAQKLLGVIVGYYTCDSGTNILPLSVSVDGSGGGTVTSSSGHPNEINCGTGGSDCSADFVEPYQVTLTTHADAGSSFTGWSGDCTGTATSCVVSMTQARNVTATFDITPTPQSLTVHLSGSGSGDVISSPAGIDCGSDCSELYDYNTSVQLTASPDIASVFDDWGGDCTGQGNPCTATMDQARDVTAVFIDASTIVAGVEFSVQPQNAYSGSSMPTVGVRAFNAEGIGVPDVQITISIDPASPACPSCAFATGSVTTLNTQGDGIAEFSDLIVENTGYDYIIIAEDSESVPHTVTSDSFHIAGFIETGSMVSPETIPGGHSGPTLTVLPDGRVLAAGGINSGHRTAIADIYDPETGKWTPTDDMIYARTTHTATLLPSGGVLVAGGFSLNTAEIYDWTTGHWSPAGSLNQPRYGHTAALLPDGRVLVAGGVNSSAVTLDSVEIYDPEADPGEEWQLVTPMNIDRNAHGMTVLPDGRILVAGGYSNSGSGRHNSAEIYDPEADPGEEWQLVTPMVLARRYFSLTLLPNGKVLAAGGEGDTAQARTTYEIYDPAVNGWTSAPSNISLGYAYSSTVLANGNVLIVGGIDGAGRLDTAEIYDWATNSWSSAGKMSTVRSFSGAALLPSGQVLVSGGDGSDGSTLSGAELYYPIDPPFQYPGFTAVPNMAEERRNHTATLLPDGTTLIVGGGPTDNELYDPNAGIVTDRFGVGVDFQALTYTADNVGYGPNLFYFIRHDETIDMFGTISTSGAVTDRFGVGVNLHALTYTADNLGYGPHLFYYLRHNDGDGQDYFGTISTLGAVTDRFSVGGNFYALTYAAEDLGYGPNLFYYLRQDPVSSQYWFGTISTSGAVTDRFNLRDRRLQSLTYTAADIGYGSNLFYYLGRDDIAEGTNNLGTLAINGGIGIIDRFHVGNEFGDMVFAADYVGYGTNLLYYLRYEGNFYTFGTISTDTSNGGFIRTASWSEVDARMGHTATLLPNGKVLIAGGSDDVYAELYNPEDHTFTQSTDNMDARSFHTATLLPNGKVLVTGGRNVTVFLNSSQLYDPLTDSWTDTASPMPTARAYHTATLLPNGKVLVFGGTGDVGIMANPCIYDPVADSWTSISTLTSIRTGHTATLLPNGKVLIAGGGVTQATIYDPYDSFNGGFTEAAFMNANKSFFSSQLLPNGNVLLTGGSVDGSQPSTSSAYIYDPYADLFTEIDNMNSERIGHQATLQPEGTILITGGQMYEDGVYSTLRTAEIYSLGPSQYPPTEHTISASASVGGTISPSGDVSVSLGSDQTFTITPGPGFIATVLVDGEQVYYGTEETTYTFSHVTEDHTIFANFSSE